MRRNDGSGSEAIFEDRMALGGKTVFVYSLVDTKQIKGAMGPKGFAKAGPSDYIVTENGNMYYAEVKSSNNATSFSFSNFTPSQNAAMVRQCAAKGQYWIFIHNLITDVWYRVPASEILMVKLTKKSSIKWSEMEEYKWL